MTLFRVSGTMSDLKVCNKGLKGGAKSLVSFGHSQAPHPQPWLGVPCSLFEDHLSWPSALGGPSNYKEKRVSLGLRDPSYGGGNGWGFLVIPTCFKCQASRIQPTFPLPSG